MLFARVAMVVHFHACYGELDGCRPEQACTCCYALLLYLCTTMHIEACLTLAGQKRHACCYALL